MPSFPTPVRVALGLACLSCLSGFALLAQAARSVIPFGPPPLLSALAFVELAASVASIGALFLAFSRALRAPAPTGHDELVRCWQGTAITAAIALLPGITLLF